ncbi:hypothetical protein KUTeg_001479, partial [Tegillarca granosa]
MPQLEYDNRLKSKQILKAGTSLSLQVNISARLSIDTTEEVSTITVKNALLDDGGVYSIIAKNDVGKLKPNLTFFYFGIPLLMNFGFLADKPSKPNSLHVIE